MKLAFKGLVVVGLVAGFVAVSAPAVNATNNSRCIDGSIRKNIEYTWNSRDNITVGPAKNQPLCADVDIYLSSYTMPDNYNGERFSNNPTATPQYIYASTLFTLKKGSTQPVTVSVDVPNECTNIQSDIYYPPEVKEVGPSGHPSNQIINGTIFAKTKDDCTPPVVEEPPVVVEEDEPEVLAEQVEVKEIAKTGSTSNALLAVLASLGTYATTYRLRK